MKTSLKLLALLVPYITMVTSCTKPTGTNPSAPPPTIKVAIDKNSMNTGDLATVSFTATGSVNLKNMHIEDIMTGSTTGFVLKDSSISTKQLAYAFIYSTGIPGTRQIKVTVTDINNQSVSDMVAIVVGGGSQPIGVYIKSNLNSASWITPLTLEINARSYDILKKIKITSTLNHQTKTVLDTAISIISLDLFYKTFPPNTGEGFTTYAVTVTDARNFSAKDSIYILTFKPLHYFGLLMLDVSSGPQFVNTKTGKSYNQTDAATVQSSIDLGFVSLPSGQILLASPATMGVPWSTVNQTFYETSSSSIDPTTVSGSQLQGWFDADSTLLAKGQEYLGVGGVFFFRTADSRYGILNYNVPSVGKVQFEIYSQ